MSKQGILIAVPTNDQGENPTIVSDQYSLPVHVQGVTNNVVNELFHHHTGVASTIAVATEIEDTAIELADATGFVIGGHIQINNESIIKYFKTSYLHR